MERVNRDYINARDPTPRTQLDIGDLCLVRYDPAPGAGKPFKEAFRNHGPYSVVGDSDNDLNGLYSLSFPYNFSLITVLTLTPLCNENILIINILINICSPKQLALRRESYSSIIVSINVIHFSNFN